MKKSLLATLAAAALLVAAAPVTTYAQDEFAPAPNAQAAPAQPKHSTFYDVLFGSGFLGTLLWLALFGCLGYYIYLAIDCGILVRPSKIMPDALVNNVKEAMKEGDVVKALQFCENEPTPMSNILSAGFIHVEEGFDVISSAVDAAADLEIERIMQRLTWISVCSNLAPSLGLLGTVQGMIMCFATLASGVPDIGALAGNISQALWTTAGGLVVSIPALTFFYSIRNNANRLILRMTALTMELIKPLRNVEVDSEA